MRILVTGGAGFIGTNAVERFLSEGHMVYIIDNLSRKGCEKNLHHLKSFYDFEFKRIDIRNGREINEYLEKISPLDAIIHLAAQVAVTESIKNPKEDFDSNALGTLNLLEATRSYSPDSVFIYSSTNKVYGALEDVEIREKESCYELVNPKNGISENHNLDFYSPYGCSKGAADQYVRDFARIYGMKTVVCRQSCIYGEHQFGIEDQGWVAWFAIRSILGMPIHIYGNGKQVRDLLFVDDLVHLYEVIIGRIEAARGLVFNIGGGTQNSVSLLQVLEIFREFGHKPSEILYENWRPGDQRIYISDISLAERILGWNPKIGIRKGSEKLFNWIEDNIGIIKKYARK